MSVQPIKGVRVYISKEELTNQKVFDIFNSAFMQPAMDDDGEVKLRIEGISLWVNVSDRGFLVLKTGFNVKPTATRVQVLELCNRINDKMIMVRCCLPERTSKALLWVDHWTMLEGGISAEEIVAASRRFVDVIRGGLSEYDTEDIVL